MHIAPVAVVLLLSLSPVSAQKPEAPGAEFGHSSHGAAFDEGPRQRPIELSGIGRAPMPITTKVPEVQEWFDQGNTLLHSFWYYEAERAFRWCIKLDPDCAMAYLWLMRCKQGDPGKSKLLLEQAVARKDKVSEKERRIIEAYEESFMPSLDRPPIMGRAAFFGGNKRLTAAVERLVIDYPEDVELKMLLVSLGAARGSRYAKDAILQQVLAKSPQHPGAHHLRIHNWDSIELGHVALDSCKAYGPIAPYVGHANHMPGHIYTKIGMWHEGSISLDAATRVEKDYMRKQLIFPYNAWNYSHNRNFLAYAQSMLGMPSLALQGARDMLNAPLDPKYNKENTAFSVFGQGMSALRRTLVRFERWDEILTEGRIPWRKSEQDKLWQQYCEAMAHIGKGDLVAAEELFQKLREKPADAGMPPELQALLGGGDAPGPKAKKSDKAKKKPEQSDGDELFPGIGEFLARRNSELRKIMEKEVEARIRLARGQHLRGIATLQEAAELELERRKTHNDPPDYPRSLYTVLGEAYLDLDSPRLAVDAFEKSLEVLRNSGFALAGLTRAWHALGDEAKAREYFARMLHVWASAEPGIWQNEKARALGIQAEPKDISPAEQRSYATETLAKLGPRLWEPYAAPALDARDVTGKHVTLDEFRGKNVLLVFYLSDQCVHCMEQLQAIQKRIKEFEKRDTVLLAISADQPEKNKENDLKDMPFRVLSDSADHANALRFLSFDEFEDLELHSTNFIDRQGRLRWARTGGDPFMDMDFLLSEIDRIERMEKAKRLDPIRGGKPSRPTPR